MTRNRESVRFDTIGHDPLAYGVRALTVAGTGVMVLVLAVCGCRSKPSPETQPARVASPIEKAVIHDPVKLVVRADKDFVTIAEPLTLTIMVTAPEGVEVRMPPHRDQLGDFDVIDFTEEADVPVDAGRRWTQRYVLEKYLPGEDQIPTIDISFADRRDETAEPAKGEFSTPPLSITVTSVLGEGPFDPADFRDIKGPVPLPVKRDWSWLWWPMLAAAVAAALVVLIKQRRRRQAQAIVERPVPPGQWARRELRQLESEQLLEHGMVQVFYFRLTGIVREYIERRFGLMAPERTTDEFLSEVHRMSVLTDQQKGSLGLFLQAADLVKFARYEPPAGESDEALATARRFVDETAEPGAPAGNDGHPTRVPSEEVTA